MNIVNRWNWLGLLLAGGILGLPVGTSAQPQPELIATHEDWDVYELMADGGKICYIASDPTESEPDVPGRSETWVLVTHRPSLKIKNEVGVIAGYEYQPDTSVTAIVDSKRFEMFTQADGAWLRTREEELQMVTDMKRGKRLTVVGQSSGGVTTTDKYSLFGFTAAHRDASKACE